MLVSAIIGILLLATACKKELVYPVLEEQSPDASLSGNAGWKGQKPVPRSNVNNSLKRNTSSASMHKQLGKHEVYDTINRGILDSRAFQKQNGQKVYLEKLSSGSYNMVKINQDGALITQKDCSTNYIAETGMREKWPMYIQEGIYRDTYE